MYCQGRLEPSFSRGCGKHLEILSGDLEIIRLQFGQSRADGVLVKCDIHSNMYQAPAAPATGQAHTYHGKLDSCGLDFLLLSCDTNSCLQGPCMNRAPFLSHCILEKKG